MIMTSTIDYKLEITTIHPLEELLEIPSVYRNILSAYLEAPLGQLNDLWELFIGRNAAQESAVDSFLSPSSCKLAKIFLQSQIQQTQQTFTSMEEQSSKSISMDILSLFIGKVSHQNSSTLFSSLPFFICVLHV